MNESDFLPTKTRAHQLKIEFGIEERYPECTDEYIKIPVDLPWDELEKDVDEAWNIFGYYGKIQRSKTSWDRSPLYVGLGLNWNPDYRLKVTAHAQAFGAPRGSKDMTPEEWKNLVWNKDYEETKGEIKGFNTYDDYFGMRVPTDLAKFKSIAYAMDAVKRPMFQGRLAMIRGVEAGHLLKEEDKEFIWHTDEPNEMLARLLIPITYDDDYFIEFQTGTKMYFEPGYAYHFNTYKPHRWNFHKNPSRNRSALVIGWSPWLDFDGHTWSTNKWTNKVHPMDMVKQGLVLK